MSLISGFVKSLSKLSMIGRALMLPISLLPAAGLLLAFGDKFHLPLMMNAGGVIFDNLPMLFCYRLCCWAGIGIRHCGTVGGGVRICHQYYYRHDAKHYAGDGLAGR